MPANGAIRIYLLVTTEEPSRAEVAAKIRARREALGLSQTQAAAEAHLSLRTYQRAEDPKDIEGPSLDSMDRIATALGIPRGALQAAPLSEFIKPAKLRLFELIAALDDPQAEEVLAFAEELKSPGARSSSEKSDRLESEPERKRSSKT